VRGSLKGLELQTLFGRTQGFFRVTAQHLQHHKGQQHESYMAHQCLIDSCLTGRQPGELLGVSKDRLDGSA